MPGPHLEGRPGRAKGPPYRAAACRGAWRRPERRRADTVASLTRRRCLVWQGPRLRCPPWSWSFGVRPELRSAEAAQLDTRAAQRRRINGRDFGQVGRQAGGGGLRRSRITAGGVGGAVIPGNGIGHGPALLRTPFSRDLDHARMPRRALCCRNAGDVVKIAVTARGSEPHPEGAARQRPRFFQQAACRRAGTSGCIPRAAQRRGG